MRNFKFTKGQALEIGHYGHGEAFCQVMLEKLRAEMKIYICFLKDKNHQHKFGFNVIRLLLKNKIPYTTVHRTLKLAHQ